MIRVGVIGLGEIGVTHAVIFNSIPQCRTKAICDKARLRVEVARRLFPEIAFYTDYERMVAEEGLDLVVVATPTPNHNAIVRSCVRTNHDISILVEKPLAVDYTQALGLVEVERQSAGMFTVGYQKRFSGTFRKARELLQNGVIGKLNKFRSSFAASALTKPQEGWRYKKGTGGVTRDFGPHLLDLLLWFFGQPVSVKSTTKSIYSAEVDDFVQASFVFKDGLEGLVELNWARPEYKYQELSIAVEGREGFLQVTDDTLIVRTDHDSERISHLVPQSFYASDLAPQVPFLFSEPEYTLQDQNFVECLRSRKRPEQTFETAADVNRLIDLILSSSSGEQHARD